VIGELIAKDLRLPPSYISRLARTASHRYYTFTIPKQNGDKRTIHHPARELKLIQRWLIARVFGRLPVHDAACAYRRGLGITAHAIRHSGYNFLLKLDFREFFPSLRGEDIVAMLRENSGLLREVITDESDYDVIRQFVCRENRLTIGAPTSPVISNLIMFGFDRDWAARSGALGVSYSRYADDLCFSTNTPNVLAGVFHELNEDIAARRSPRLVLNEKKTVFTSRKRLRRIVGLVLTSTRNLSIGRSKKRNLKSQVFRFNSGKLSIEDVDHLRGMLPFVRSVEPSFIDALGAKFGPETMNKLGL
jgi:RNA-directed DNA polymerase